MHTVSGPADGNTGWFFLLFGRASGAHQYSNSPLGKVLAFTNLIYLLNCKFALLHVFPDTFTTPHILKSPDLFTVLPLVCIPWCSRLFPRAVRYRHLCYFPTKSLLSVVMYYVQYFSEIIYIPKQYHCLMSYLKLLCQ